MVFISIVNQKGGVAKTTTAINLSTALALLNYKVLVIDADQQSNLTKGFGITSDKHSFYSLLIKKEKIKNVIQETTVKNLYIIPSNIDLADAEIELLKEDIARELVLKDILDESNLDFDYVIFDCGPSLGILTINVLCASNEIIIPIEPAQFSIDGMTRLFSLISKVKRKLNPSLQIRGMLLTKLDLRTSIAKDFKKAIKEMFKEYVFDTYININVKIPESQSESTPVILFDKKCKGTEDYMNLAKELIERG